MRKGTEAMHLTTCKENVRVKCHVIVALIALFSCRGALARDVATQEFRGTVNAIAIDTGGTRIAVALTPNFARDPETIKILEWTGARWDMRGFDMGKWVAYSVTFVSPDRILFGGEGATVVQFDKSGKDWKISEPMALDGNPEKGKGYALASLKAAPNSDLFFAANVATFAGDLTRSTVHLVNIATRRQVSQTLTCTSAVWVSPTTLAAACDDRVVCMNSDGRTMNSIKARSLGSIGPTSGNAFWFIDLGLVRIAHCEQGMGSNKRANIGLPVFTGASQGDLAVFAADEGEVIVFDFAADSIAARKKLFPEESSRLAISGDGKVVVGASRKGDFISVWRR